LDRLKGGGKRSLDVSGKRDVLGYPGFPHTEERIRALRAGTVLPEGGKDTRKEDFPRCPCRKSPNVKLRIRDLKKGSFTEGSKLPYRKRTGRSVSTSTQIVA